MKVIYKFNYQYDTRNERHIDYERRYKFIFGKKYNVMGICMFASNSQTLYFLIKTSNSIEWFPDSLFAVSDRYNKIPFNWHMSIDNGICVFLMGYHELVDDKKHFVGLRNNREKDIEIFEKRYNEIREWEKQLDYYNKEITYEDILSKIDFSN